MLGKVKTSNISWCHCSNILTKETLHILNCQKTYLLIILNYIVKEVVKGNSNDPSDALILSPVAKKALIKVIFFQYLLIESTLTMQI